VQISEARLSPQRLRARQLQSDYAFELVGMALWLYGYFATGNPSLIDWHANTPWWIADFLAEHRNADGFVAATA
jgi:hypothetical protein